MKTNKEKDFFAIIFFYYKKFKWFFLLMVLFISLSVVSRIVQPKLINQILSQISTKGDWLTPLIIMCVLIFFITIFTFLTNLLGGKLGKKIEIEVRKETFANLIKQDMSFFSKNKTGETLTKIISDTAIIGDQSQRVPSQILSSIFTIVGASIILFTIDVWLTLISLTVTCLIIIIVVFSFSLLRKRMLETRKTITEINGDITNKLSTISLIKSLGTEEKENKSFEDAHVKYYKTNNKVNNIISIVITIMTAGIMSISTIVILSGVLMYHDDPKLFIILPSFLSGLSLMISPIIQFAQLSQGLAQAMSSSKRISEITSYETLIDVLDNKNKIVLEELDYDISFDKVSFSYPEKPDIEVLKDVSFKFKKGTRYAIVGTTGSGKSTISKLILRFYKPTSGNIFIGDKNIDDIYIPSLLKNIGYVEQEPQIFFGTVFDNIVYGLDNVSKKDVVEACKKANIDSLIESWPKKYNTLIGERGLTLSGGQKQRIVIARMFLRNPKILILDEATSSLDNVVEKEINGEFRKLSKNRTTIVIAHRLSTIKDDVDEIIVLKKDKGIIEHGTFDSLMKKNGEFKKIYNAGAKLKVN